MKLRAIFCVLGYTFFLHPMNNEKQFNKEQIHGAVTKRLLESIIEHQVRCDLWPIWLFGKNKQKQIIEVSSRDVSKCAQNFYLLHNILVHAQKNGDECYKNVALLCTHVESKTLIDYMKDMQISEEQNPKREREIYTEFCSAMKKLVFESSPSTECSVFHTFAKQTYESHAKSLLYFAQSALKSFQDTCLLHKKHQSMLSRVTSLFVLKASLQNKFNVSSTRQTLQTALEYYAQKEIAINTQTSLLERFVWPLFISFYESGCFCETLLTFLSRCLTSDNIFMARNFSLEELQEAQDHALRAYEKFFIESYRDSISEQIKRMIQKELTHSAHFELPNSKRAFVHAARKPLADIGIQCMK